MRKPQMLQQTTRLTKCFPFLWPLQVPTQNAIIIDQPDFGQKFPRARKKTLPLAVMCGTRGWLSIWKSPVPALFDWQLIKLKYSL